MLSQLVFVYVWVCVCVCASACALCMRLCLGVTGSMDVQVGFLCTHGCIH
jgi:hypothetical protein